MRFDLYRAPDADSGTIAEGLARALAVEFELHESEYFGRDYYLSRVPNASVKVVPNYVDNEGYPLEPSVGSADVLVYVDGELADVEDLASRLPASLELVRSETM